MGDVELDDRGVVIKCPSCGQKNRLAYVRLADAVKCGRCREQLSAPGVPIEIASSADFDRLIARASIPVVVDYWAAGARPAPDIEAFLVSSLASARPAGQRA